MNSQYIYEKNVELHKNIRNKISPVRLAKIKIISKF